MRQEAAKVSIRGVQDDLSNAIGVAKVMGEECVLGRARKVTGDRQTCAIYTASLVTNATYSACG